MKYLIKFNENKNNEAIQRDLDQTKDDLDTIFVDFIDLGAKTVIFLEYLNTTYNKEVFHNGIARFYQLSYEYNTIPNNNIYSSKTVEDAIFANNKILERREYINDILVNLQYHLEKVKIDYPHNIISIYIPETHTGSVQYDSGFTLTICIPNE